MWAAEAVQDTSSVWFEIIENFRFEDVNGYEDESWLKVSFAYSQKKIDILESFIIYTPAFSTETLALLSSLKDVKPSPDRNR